MPEPTVEIALVSYRSAGVLAGLVASLPADLPMAIVDNFGEVEALSPLVERRVGRLLADGPGGFAGAANLAARTSTADVVIFVNPDSRPSIETLRALAGDVATSMATSSPVVAVSATLVGEDGRLQIGVGGWEPTISRALVTLVGLGSRLPGRGLWARPEPGQDPHFEWLSGACLAVDRERFLSIGGFDERYFVYCEDMALGRRIRDAGFTEALRPDLLVSHVGASSGAPQSYSSWLTGIAFRDYLLDHNAAWRARTILVLQCLAVLLRLPVNLLRSGSRASREQTFAFVKGMLSPRSVVATRGRTVTAGPPVGSPPTPPG